VAVTQYVAPACSLPSISGIRVVRDREGLSSLTTGVRCRNYDSLSGWSMIQMPFPTRVSRGAFVGCRAVPLMLGERSAADALRHTHTR
jgi:hypothetical protein